MTTRISAAIAVALTGFGAAQAAAQPASAVNGAMPAAAVAPALPVSTLPSPVVRSPGLPRTMLPAASKGLELTARFDAAAAQRSGQRLSVAGGIGGFIVGGLAGGLAACHFNRDSYGVFCAGQNDTKLVIGAALGGAAGAALGAWLFRRSG